MRNTPEVLYSLFGLFLIPPYRGLIQVPRIRSRTILALIENAKGNRKGIDGKAYAPSIPRPGSGNLHNLLESQ